MSQTVGTNIFPILVVDISGAPIEGLTTGWSVYGQSGDSKLDTITSITEAIDKNGWYLATVSLPSGQGFLEFRNSDTSAYVTGTYTIDTDVYDADDLYSNFARQELDFTQTAIGVYESQDLGTFKEGDDWDFLYVVPSQVEADISGYSNWKASMFNVDVLTTAVISGSGYIGDFTLTPDGNTNSVRFQASHTITDGIVPEGSIETNVYTDLQAEKDGKRKTFAEFVITCRRQFTKT